MAESTEAYRAGYHCGYYGADTNNSNYKYFASKQLMEEWTKGKAAGQNDKAKNAPYRFRTFVM